MTEQTRKEFEEWWASTPILGDNKRTIAEKAWEASRAAIEVDLPTGGFYAGYDNEHMIESRDVRENLEALGLKVKP